MFQKFGHTILLERKIRQFEKENRLALPKDYRRFLLRTNGGTFVPGENNEEFTAFAAEGVEESVIIDALFGFGHDRGLNISEWREEYSDELPEECVIIGSSVAGELLLFWEDGRTGVYLWDHCLELDQSTEEECLYRIAGSFSEFFDSLKEESF